MIHNTQNSRIFGLDIVRTCAILLVVLGHGGFILDNTILEDFPYFSMIDGVTIFFVLSGFLIGNILLIEINKFEKFKISDLLTFWKRRWFRTLPNYYLILLLNFLVVKYGIIKEDISQFNFKFLFFSQNFKSPFFGFFWESWSLSVEEWFYIITPILVFFLLKIIKPKYSFLISTLIMIVLPLIYRFYIYNPTIDHFWWDVTVRKTVLCRLDSIGYGLLLAWIYYYYSNFWEKIKIPSFLIGVLLIAFILNFEQEAKTHYKQIIYFSLTPLSVMFLLPLSESYKKASGFFAKSIEHISKISYSIYLIHLALIAEVIRDNFPPQGGIDGIIKYVAYLTITIVVSSLLYKYFEKPIMNLRDKDFTTLFSKK